MAQIDYLLIGHITADLVKRERILGGTVSYAAPVARAFGNRVGLLTSAADAEPLLDPLHAVADVISLPSEKTTTFSNVYHDGQRTQTVHAVAQPLTVDAVPIDWLQARYVHLGPLVSEVDPLLARHFPDATVLLTPQGYLREWQGDGIVTFKRWLDHEMLSHVNIVIFSTQDIALAPELEREFVQACEWVIVTDGYRGGRCYHRGAMQPYLAYPTEELDPTGAGDVFAASLLASLQHLDNDMSSAVQTAAYLAALSVSRRGAWQEFSPDEIQEALQINKDT